MRLFLSMILLLTAFAGEAWSQSSTRPVPKGMSIVLPADGSVKAEWVAEPLPEAQVRRSAIAFQKFLIDPKGAVWMASNQKSLANLVTGFSFSLASPVKDLVFLDDGALFIVHDTALGFIPPVDDGKLSRKDPVLPFQPVLRLPVEKCMIASDGKTGIFVYGHEQATQTYAVFELLKGFSGWNKVFVSGEMITAVCADEGTLYIACRRKVYRLHLGEKELELVFVHPLDTVTGLVFKPGTGLFYATNKGIGVIAQGALEFIKCPSPQIAIKNNVLYVFLPDSLAELRLTGVEHLVQQKKKE